MHFTGIRCQIHHFYEKLNESLTILIFFNVTLVISVGKNCVGINIENSFKATFPRTLYLP